MAYLAQTPQQDIQAALTEAGEKSKQAMMWFILIAVVVAFIVFSGKSR